MNLDLHGLDATDPAEVVDMLLCEAMPSRDHVSVFVEWLAGVAAGIDADDVESIALLGRGASTFARYLVHIAQGDEQAVPLLLPWSAISHKARPDQHGVPVGAAVFAGQPDDEVCPGAWADLCDATHVLVATRDPVELWPPPDSLLPFSLTGRRTAGLRQHLEDIGCEA
jgi:hypothetical protein